MLLRECARRVAHESFVFGELAVKIERVIPGKESRKFASGCHDPFFLTIGEKVESLFRAFFAPSARSGLTGSTGGLGQRRLSPRCRSACRNSGKNPTSG